MSFLHIYCNQKLFCGFVVSADGIDINTQKEVNCILYLVVVVVVIVVVVVFI